MHIIFCEKILKLDFSCPGKKWGIIVISAYFEKTTNVCLAMKNPFWDFFHENSHACIVFMYKNEILKNWNIF